MAIFEKISKDGVRKLELCWERRWVLKYYENNQCNEKIKFNTAQDAFETFEEYDIGETH